MRNISVMEYENVCLFLRPPTKYKKWQMRSGGKSPLCKPSNICHLHFRYRGKFQLFGVFKFLVLPNSAKNQGQGSHFIYYVPRRTLFLLKCCSV